MKDILELNIVFLWKFVQETIDGLLKMNRKNDQMTDGLGIQMRSKLMNDIIQMPKGNYIMKSAVRVNTGVPRTDGWYPEWVGMTMQFRPIPIGWIAQFRYVKDNNGNPYYGGMHTSPVVSVDIATDESFVEITTKHTVFTFEKVT